MRLLAFSDIHGNVKAVEKLVSEVSRTHFDFIIFAGDFTTAFYDGAEEGKKQMREITSLISALKKPLYYVYGNRDYYIPPGFHGTDHPIKGAYVKCPTGNNIEEKDWKIDNYLLTNKIDNLDQSKILVTHKLHPKLKSTQANAVLYVYGHDHVGRIYKNYFDLGFLYKGKEVHGVVESLLGCYWFIDLDNEGNFELENHSWQLRKSSCSIHKNRGTFYFPYYWKKDCPLCYKEDDELKF